LANVVIVTDVVVAADDVVAVRVDV